MDIGIPKIFTKKLVKEDFIKKCVSYFMAYTPFYKLIFNFLMRLSEQHTLLNLAVFYHLLNNIISLITVGHYLESKLIYIWHPILKFIVLQHHMPKNTTIIRIVKPIFTANFVIYRHKRQILKSSHNVQICL